MRADAPAAVKSALSPIALPGETPMIRAFCLLLLALAFAASGPAAAQKVYKWVDKNGVVHYADAPPEGVKFERVNVSTGQARTEREGEDGAEGEEGAQGDAAATAAAPAEVSPQCRQAQANLDTLQNNRRVRKDVDGDGEPEEISGDALREEVERARKLVEAYCS
jgi:hypothetical protein